MGIESIIRKVGMFAVGGLAFLAASCMPLRKPYVEPRLGAVVPVAEEEKDYNASLSIGASYGFEIDPVRKLGFEASLDYFGSSEQYIETNSLLLGVNATYLVRDVNPSVYLTGGFVLLNEFSNIDIPAPFNVHDEKTDSTFGLSFGTNVRFNAEDVGVRLNYIFLFGENVKGMLVLTGDYRLSF
jgi:hypothetical protein